MRIGSVSIIICLVLTNNILLLMFGIKLYKTYNKVKDILVKPRLKCWFGKWFDAPFMICKHKESISVFGKTFEIPTWLTFKIYNYDFAGKWKFDTARFEWKGVFAIVAFGYCLSFYLTIPDGEDGQHEDAYYEFMMEFLDGDYSGDLIRCIMDAGIVISWDKGEERTFNSLSKTWFKPQWHKAYDIAYERLAVKRKHNCDEWILCSAIKRKEPREGEPYWKGTNDIMSIELGMRHHDIFHRFHGELIETEQGFYTSKGRYVDRKEGAEIAYAAGQIDTPVNKLFSEDLY